MFKCVAALSLVAGASTAIGATVAEGEAAYEQNRISDAEAIYAAVAADKNANPTDRARSQRELARIAWLIDRNADVALRHLAGASATGAQPCENMAMEGRVLREANRFGAGSDRQKRLLAGCGDPLKRDLIRIQLVLVGLDMAARNPAHSKRHLAKAKAELELLGPDAAAGSEAATARLEIGLLTRDVTTALRGWKDYYWLDQRDVPPALATFDAARLFSRGLSAKATKAAQVDLAYLLMRAGFADQVRRFGDQAKLPGKASNRRWRLIAAYLAERDKIKAVELRVNRSLARGGSKEDQSLEKAVTAGLSALMAAASATGDPRAALAEHYGLLGTVGETSGYPSIHIGHLVEQRQEIVRQYGKQAEVRFAAIDNMWGNGFESWLWDGGPAAGGWSGDGAIIQVRPSYTSGPIGAFGLVGDTGPRRELVARQAHRAAEDLANAAAGKSTVLVGLSDRLRLQFIDQIAARVRANSAGGDFRRSFLDEYWRANLQQSIFVHEGRHAIDQAMSADPSKLDSMTLEYTAKLSELALSDYPRMGLWNMNRGIGGESPHDRAGTKIFTAIAEWIRTHPAQISGYDPQLPALVQIDKLTDDQIREIARSLDPLAQAAPATASAGNRS